MNYKAIIYVISLFISIFAISGINFDGFIKKNKALEARVLVLILSISLIYLLTNFITDFVDLTSIIN